MKHFGTELHAVPDAEIGHEKKRQHPELKFERSPEVRIDVFALVRENDVDAQQAGEQEAKAD